MDERDDELVIDFGRSGNSDAYRRTGWYEPEPRHSWTQGQESALEFPRPSLAGDYLMVLELGPFLWKDKLPAQRLMVFVNGSEVADFVVSEVSVLEFQVPWELIDGREWVQVIFRHPDTAKPVEISGVPDHREIAFAFEAVTFFRKVEPLSGPPEAYAQPGADDDPETLPVDQLMMRFESLGENCEFGLAQRRCGAEPLGLLRFASAPMPTLLSALRGRFEGMGEPDNIEVQIAGNQQEYLVVDKSFGFLYHPWVLVGEADPEDIRRREAKRLPFLRRKLLEDLQDASKIFVYRGMHRLPQPLMLRLVAAMHSYGPTTLLWVELQDPAHPAGTVEWVAAGLLKGYIDRFAPGENAHALSLDCWITICRTAAKLAQTPPQ
jgi:hypothetical protein